MSIFLYSNFLFLILWKMRESYSMAFFLCRQHQYDNPATFTLPLSLSLERAFPVVKRFPFLVNSRPPIPTQTLLLQSRKRERDCRRRRVKQLNLPPHIQQQQQQHIGELLSRSFSNLSAIAHYFDIYIQTQIFVLRHAFGHGGGIVYDDEIHNCCAHIPTPNGLLLWRNFCFVYERVRRARKLTSPVLFNTK